MERQGLARGSSSQSCARTANDETWSWGPSSESFTELTTGSPRPGLQTHRHANCKPKPGGASTPSAAPEEGPPVRTRPHQAPPPLRQAPGAGNPTPAASANPRAARAGQRPPGPRRGSFPPSPAAGAPAGKQPTRRSPRGAQHCWWRGVPARERRVPASRPAGRKFARDH